MRIVIFINGTRGISVLEHILALAGFEVPAVVTPVAFSNSAFASLQTANHFAHLELADVNSLEAFTKLGAFHPEVFNCRLFHYLSGTDLANAITGDA